MKYTRTLTALLLASSLTASTAVVAQEPGAAAAVPALTTDEQAAGQEELERKALALLDEVIGETPSLKLVENRVRLRAAAVEILWPRDQERAREIFNAAANDLSAATSGIDTDDPQYQNLTNTISQLRHRMLGVMGERDPKLALEFLRATRQPPPPVPPGVSLRQPDQELMLETQLAQQIAARDPQQALRIAEETLSRGLSANLMPLLTQLRTSDPEGAARLTANIIKKLRTANFAVDYEATNIASYLLLSTRPAENANAQQQTIAADQTGARRPQLDESVRRDLVNLLVNAVAAGNAGNARRSGNMGGLLSTVRELMPEVERYAPTQAAALRRRVEGDESRVGGNYTRVFHRVPEASTPEALIEAAAKAAPEMREQLYRTAVWKAFNEGNPDRARQIINNHVEGARQREEMLKELDQQLFWRAASEGKVEQAQAFLARIKSKDERVGMLLQLAQVTAGRGNAEVAVDFLDEAWNLIGGRAKNHSQFGLQLQVAHNYAPLAPPRAFEIIEASVTHLNELVAAAAVLDGFGQDAFAEDELKGQEGYVWSALATQCNETLAALARVDFEQARSIAGRFQRPEVRLPARLAVAHGILFREGEQSNFKRSPVRRGRLRGGLRSINED
ncbi:MAG: hypothetical protein LC803_18195 [Acidobacteria bacterium]|nr:hypothetical protein [Acidobacteriota bacterium]